MASIPAPSLADRVAAATTADVPAALTENPEQFRRLADVVNLLHDLESRGLSKPRGYRLASPANGQLSRGSLILHGHGLAPKPARQKMN